MLRREVAGSVDLSGRFPTGGRPRCGQRPRGAWSGAPLRSGGAATGGRVSARSSAGRSTPKGRRPSRSHKGRGVGGSTPGPAKPMSSPSWCPLASASRRIRGRPPRRFLLERGAEGGSGEGRRGNRDGRPAEGRARALARTAPGGSRTGQGPASGRSLRPSGARPHEWTASAGHEAAFCGPQGARTRLLVSHGLGKVITLTGAAGDSWGQRRAVGGRRWPAGRRKAPPVATAEPAPGSSSAATPWGARAAAAARPRTRRIWSIGGNRGRNVTWHRRETCHGLRLRVQALVGGDSILPEE